MSTLRYPYKPSPRARIRYHQLSRVDNSRTKGTKLSISGLKSIHHGNSDVFRGSLKVGTSKSALDVVCKLKYQDFADMRKEARIYKRLEKCQGDTVPRCYGLFEGMLGERKVSCLVLEYCGSPFDGDLEESSWNFK